MSSLQDKFPVLLKLRGMQCPVCGVGSGVGIPIAHLNDEHLWTRERIADWVESIESQMAPQQAPDPQPVAVTI